MASWEGKMFMTQKRRKVNLKVTRKYKKWVTSDANQRGPVENAWDERGYIKGDGKPRLECLRGDSGRSKLRPYGTFLFTDK